MDNLGIFYSNKPLYESVRLYILQTLNEVALEKLFKGEDAKDVAGAKVVIDKVFMNLSETYEPKKEVNIINKAR